MTDRVVEIKPSRAHTAQAGARTILTPEESLIYQTSEKSQALFDEAINQHKTEIILDCKAVTFVDSAGLELLVKLDEDLRKRGGMLKIVNLNAVSKDILYATRLTNVLHVYKDIHEAIRNGL